MLKAPASGVKQSAEIHALIGEGSDSRLTMLPFTLRFRKKVCRKRSKGSNVNPQCDQLVKRGLTEYLANRQVKAIYKIGTAEDAAFSIGELCFGEHLEFGRFLVPRFGQKENVQRLVTSELERVRFLSSRFFFL